MSRHHDRLDISRLRHAIRPGFTLIELLVVVSVIALLISILLPALGKARQATKDAQCLSNVKQLGIANFNYVADNREYLVPWTDPGDSSLAGHLRGAGTVVADQLPATQWMDALHDQYLNRSIEVMECPLQETLRGTISYGQYKGPGGYRTYQPGYLVNRWTVNALDPGGSLLPRRVSQFQKQSRKVLHADSGLRLSTYPNLTESWAPVSTTDVAVNGTGGAVGAGLSGRHKPGRSFDASAGATTNRAGGSNMLFLDGHGAYGDWIAFYPWIVNGDYLPQYNLGNTIFKTYWDPDGDGSTSTPGP